ILDRARALPAGASGRALYLLPGPVDNTDPRILSKGASACVAHRPFLALGLPRTPGPEGPWVLAKLPEVPPSEVPPMSRKRPPTNMLQLQCESSCVAPAFHSMC